MTYSIVDIRTLPIDRLVSFYERHGPARSGWYGPKLLPQHASGRLRGQACLDTTSGEIVGAYLGLEQPLLCNPALRAVQSIDTLISPQARGGNLLRQIGEAFYRDLEAQGFDCVYGLPTRRSEPLRERSLGWNKSRSTYRYLVPLPIPLLKLAHRLFGERRESGTAPRRGPALDAAIARLRDDARYRIHDQRDLLFVAYRRGPFAKVGLVRSKRHASRLERLRVLCRVAHACDGWFLLTYATEDSETARLFSPFSLRTWALNFCGRLLGSHARFSFGETSFEFMEFDTFGLS